MASLNLLMDQDLARSCSSYTTTRSVSQLLLTCAQNKTISFSPEALPSQADDRLWGGFLDKALQHRIVPLVYQYLRQADDLIIPPDCWAELQTLAEDTKKRNLRLIFSLLSILDRLAQHHVQAIPYKGLMLSLMAYGDLHQRSFDDLDVLVDHTDYLKPRTILAELGYQSAHYHVLSAEQEQAFCEYFGEYGLGETTGEVCLDVHYRLLGDGNLTMQVDFSAAMQRLTTVTIASRQIPSLSPVDTLLYVSMNCLKNNWDNLRSVCDVAGLTRPAVGMDWILLLSEAQRLRIDRPLYLGLLIAHQLLDAPVPDEVLYQAKRDRGAQWLARLVCRRMLADLDSQQFFFPCYSFILKWVALKYWSARLYYLRGVPTRFLRLFFIVNYRDTAFIQLPRPLYFLYYFIRPIRVLCDYRTNVFKLIFK
jgi:hypothetical protein